MTTSMLPLFSVSVVIPTYNRGVLLERALRSVLRQSTPPREIIVVDDGSTDDTLSRLEAWKGQVRVVEQRHGGASRARNAGVAESSGTWVAFLDSDDVWDATYLAAMHRALVATEGRAHVYFSDVLWTFPEGTVPHWQRCGFAIDGGHVLVDKGTEWVIGEIQPMLLPFSIVRRDAYQACGGLCEDLRTGEDTHLFLKMGLDGPVCAVATCGGRVMSDEDPERRLSRHTQGDSRERWVNAIGVYEDLLRRFPSLAPRHRSILKTRLANGHWRLARVAFCERNVVAAVREVGRSMTVSPSTIISILLHPGRRKQKG
jgi:glycosyltransferase involved in cell wall biosynthesis